MTWDGHTPTDAMKVAGGLALERAMYEAEEPGTIFDAAGMCFAAMIAAAPSPPAPVPQDAFERGWKAGIEAAAEAASWAHMVPPDGGSPTEGERLVAQSAADAIRSLTPPEDVS